MGQSKRFNKGIHGENIMGKKMYKVMVVGFFPITVFCCLLKGIYKFVEKRLILRYLHSISFEKIDSLDGLEFEELLYTLFISLGVKITKTPKTRDFGADLVLIHKGKKAVIQSKLYYNHTVGNSAVQEIATAKKFYMADEAVVITNSKFSRPAIALASSVGVRLMDREVLLKILQFSKSEIKEFLDKEIFNN